MEEKLKVLLSKIHQEYSDVRYSVYRTALKLCRLQKTLKLKKIEVSNALSLLSQPLEGLSAKDPDQTFPNISYGGLKIVTTKIFAQCQANLGNEDVFPDILGELTSLLLFHIYSEDEDTISLQALRTFFIVMCNRELIGKYKSLFWCHCEPGNNTLAKQDVQKLFSNVIRITGVIHEQNHFNNIEGAVESCFSQIHGYGITEFEFIQWLLFEPQSVVWIPTMHRLSTAETSKHHVACALCKARPITGMRFRCLRCMDYDLCQDCFFMKTDHRKSHKSSHPIQEYVRPATRSDSLKDVARTIRNIVTKRYKSKTVTKSYLPIDQTGKGNGITSGIYNQMFLRLLGNQILKKFPTYSQEFVTFNEPWSYLPTFHSHKNVNVVGSVAGCSAVASRVSETWQEQSVEMTSVSIQSAASPQQNLKMSRMAAGFADVSQLADEEKAQLDQLIERLDEERRRVVATTELLSPARPPPIQNRPSSGESERQRLKDALKDVREYNRELERELEDIRFNVHSDNHSHASTPHGGAISPIHTTQRPHSSPVYYRPHDVIPMQAYAGHLHNHPHDVNYPMVQDNSVVPLYSSPDPGAIGVVGQVPSYVPRVRSQSHETGATNSYRSPMKAHPNLNSSSPSNFVLNGREPPMQMHSRGLRSHGNSPSMDTDPHIGEVQHRGSFIPQQVLPDAPFIKMNRQPQSASPASSMRSGRSQFSRHEETPKIFDGASPEMMFKSLDTSSTASDRRKKANSSVSSRDSMPKHRLSPALQQAYQRHLEATGQVGESDKSWHSYSQKTTSQKSSRRNSKDYDTDSLSDSAQSTPKFRNSQEQPLVDLVSSANISSDSLGSRNRKFKPVAIETQLVPLETENLLHSFEHGSPPRNRWSRSATPKITNIAAYVKEPDDLMGSYGSAGFPQREPSPASVSSRNSRPKSRHSRSRTSTPKVIDGFTPKNGTPTSHKSRSRNATPKIPDPSTRANPANFHDGFTSSGTPISHKSKSRNPTPKNSDPNFRTGSPKLMDSFTSGGTPSTHGSRSSKSTPKVTDTSASDLDASCNVKRDSQGSFVPPRRASSHENLNFQRQPIRSVDSDSLHSPSPNHSVGFHTSDPSDAEVERISNPVYLKEFDPYSSLYASDQGKKVAQNLKRSRKATPNKNIASGSSTTQKTSPTITPSSHSYVSNTGSEMIHKHSSHSSMSNAESKVNQRPDDEATHSSRSGAGYEMNKTIPGHKKHTSRTSNKKQNPKCGSSAESSMSDTELKMHEASQNSMNDSSSAHQPSSSTINSCDHTSMSDNGSRKKKGPRPVKPKRNPSRYNIHNTYTMTHQPRSRSNASSKHNSSANSSQRSTPKIEKRISESSSEEENVMKDKKTYKSDVGSTSKSSAGSRSTPDGDIEKEFQRSEAEPRFESPEEEMKFLISKLQELMPSMFDEEKGTDRCSPEKMHPMSEVLVAAEQTRKAIELFTEYAIAASAGEGTFL